ncbi:hypothetical protein QTP70_021717, partial [Hemibagrus guttatus]
PIGVRFISSMGMGIGHEDTAESSRQISKPNRDRSAPRAARAASPPILLDVPQAAGRLSTGSTLSTFTRYTAPGPSACSTTESQIKHSVDEVCVDEVCVGEVCVGEVCIDEVCVDEVCVGEVCVDEVCVGEVCIDEVCVDEVCVDEVCIDEVCVDEVCVGEVCVDEVCVGEVCIDEVCVDEVCVDEVCVDEVCVGEVCVDEVCVGEVCLDEVCVDEVCVDDVCVVGGAAALFKRFKKYERPGALVKLRQCGFRMVLPSTWRIPAPLKMDKRLLLSRINKDFLNSAALCFTESWLNDAIPDNALHLPGFQLFRADRVAESAGKSRGGGTCFYINKRWCADTDVHWCNRVEEDVLSRFGSVLHQL